MATYDVQKRVKIIEFFYSSGRSIITTQRNYRRHFNVRTAPSDNMIRNLVSRFEEHGRVSDLPGRGRGRSVRNEAVVEAVRQSVNEDPSVSTRRRSAQLGMSRTSLQRILKRDLKMFPYKIQMVQQLLPQDHQARLQYAIRFSQIARENDNFLNNLIMSDEAHFHLNGYVNKQNCRFWGTHNPRALLQRELHPARCTVWCGVMADKIIGPYFFEDVDGQPETVNGALYRTMIENFLRPHVENNQNIWFQQDGATAHTARATMELLHNIFGERIISRNCDFAWPPRSPDLTAPDFFLWGYLKGVVYINKPQTIQELKQNIQAEIRNLEPETLRAVMENAVKRANFCLQENGHHLRDVIFHT